MKTIAHRVRCIATIAGPERLARVDALVRGDSRIVRPLIEGTDPQALAEAFVRLLDRLDIETEPHCRRLAAWMKLFGGSLGIAPSELEHAELGALLHDIGKLSVDDATLHDPTPLDPSSFDRVQMHSSLGHAILFGVPGLARATELVRTHHEYWDGSGYPDGLAGTAAPLLSRVFAICDTYDSMVRTDREYRSAVEHGYAVDELRSLAGKKYDPELVRAFLAIDQSAWREISARFPDRPRLCAA